MTWRIPKKTEGVSRIYHRAQITSKEKDGTYGVLYKDGDVSHVKPSKKYFPKATDKKLKLQLKKWKGLDPKKKQFVFCDYDSEGDDSDECEEKGEPVAWAGDSDETLLWWSCN